MKIIIFGASGFLGTNLKKRFLEKGHTVLGVDSKGKTDLKVDATKSRAVYSFLKKEKPDLIIDTIGLTSSLECERNPKKALLLNYETAKNISKYSKENTIPLVFISSSYVFDGLNGNYSEEEKINPLNEYGRTKVMAEKEVLKSKKAIVLRVDILYGFNGEGKSNGVFQKILSGKKIEINKPNQVRQPLFVNDLANIILSLIKKNKKGLFNIAGPEKISLYNFIRNLEKIIRKDSKIEITEDHGLLKIPKNSTLDISRIKSLGITTTPLNKGLVELKKKFNSEQF